MARTVFVQIGFSAAGLISYFRESWVGGAYWATPCIPPDKLVKPGFHMSGKF